MDEPGRILIADDEETFLKSTAALLRQAGYYCETAPDASCAMGMLQNGEFDLLIADIKMPGNPELELVRDLPDVAPGLPVILVTGYPSVRSATQSVHLPVIAYVLKPVAIEDLLLHVRAGIDRYRLYRRVTVARRKLDDWRRDLEDLERLMSSPSNGAGGVDVKSFVDMSVHNILGAIMDLKHLSEALAEDHTTTGAEQLQPPTPCHLLTCPQVALLTDALNEAIVVLRGTKSSFKSKALGDLRGKLEEVVASRTDWIAREGATPEPGGSPVSSPPKAVGTAGRT